MPIRSASTRLKSIFLLLTHAHLDHCGRIPLLVKRGFKGEIITTQPTRELTRLVLMDSAHLQEEEFRALAAQGPWWFQSRV